MSEAVTITGVSDGTLYTLNATPAEMAAMLRELGYPKDAARMEAAEAKRERRRALRRG